MVWRMLQSLTQVATSAPDLFPDSAAAKQYWPDLREYIRIAHTYYRAASTTGGVASALPLYYSALQLAKAELLVKDPHSVFQKEAHHGLTFRPERSKSMRSDKLRVRSGVFRSLYRARTGLAIDDGTNIPVKALLQRLPDIGFEVAHVKLGPPTFQSFEHYVGHDGAQAWSLVTIPNDSVCWKSAATRKRLLDKYRRVAPWHNTPAPADHVVLESVCAHTLLSPNLCVADDQDRVCGEAMKALAPLVGSPIYLMQVMAPSLVGGEFLPMPPDLARYASIFYLSSVIRYKPSRVSEDAKTDDPWLLSALVAEAGVHLVRSFLDQISGTQYLFASPEATALRSSNLK